MTRSCIDAANCKEGPSRGIAGSRDIADVVGLEEVELVFGAAINTTRQDGEELEEDAAGEEYEGR